MAKLVTSKEKYGISVATRIDPDMAHQISERAQKLGISFAKMVGMLVVRGFNPQEPVYVDRSEDVEALEEQVADLQLELNDTLQSLYSQQSLYQRTAAQFIEKISENQEEQILFAQTYNGVLSELKEEES